jgi:hypothetical protein
VDLTGGLLGVVCAGEMGLVVVRTRSCEFHSAMRSAMSVALANRGVVRIFPFGRRVDGRGFGVDIGFPGVETNVDFRALAGMLGLGL